MGETTAIAWTDHTFNPWVGCQRVSPGCQHCYAEALDKRWGNEHWGKDAERRVTSDANWRLPLKWNRQAEAAGRQELVFCASMADVFEDRPDLLEPRRRLFEMIEDTPFLVWQLLTKRPENVNRLIPERWRSMFWPTNVWLGTTVEDEIRAHERIPHLLAIAARVRFLSCEPLLDRVRLGPWCGSVPDRLRWDGAGGLIPEYDAHHTIDWVICGGESGPGHRALNLEHARTLRLNCDVMGIPFFFKQVGGQHPTSGGDRLDGQVLKAFPASIERGVPVSMGLLDAT